MWILNSKGEKEFSGGKKDWAGAAEAAKLCLHFTTDDEDELVSDEPVSCYNCRYRRWNLKSFTCEK